MGLVLDLPLSDMVEREAAEDALFTKKPLAQVPSTQHAISFSRQLATMATPELMNTAWEALSVQKSDAAQGANGYQHF
jgi:hypothetical protein